MTLPSLRPYLQLASGIGEMTKARALEAAQGLLALPGVEEASRRAAQATALADDLLETARANRDGLVHLVREEIEGALTRADLAKVADLDAARGALTRLTQDVEELRSLVTGVGRRAGLVAEREVAERASAVIPDVAPVSVPPAKKATAKKAPAKKAAAKKAPAKKAPAKKATATKAPARKTTAAKSTAKKSTAKKTTVNRTAAKKAPAKKAAPAKKTTAKKAPAKKAPAKKATTKKTAAKKATASQAGS